MTPTDVTFSGILQRGLHDEKLEKSPKVQNSFTIRVPGDKDNEHTNILRLSYVFAQQL
jgi:hypothetical protein